VKTKSNLTRICLLLMALFALPGAVQAQFTYTNINGTITITGYTGSGGAVTIPSTINGLPVTSIGASAFYNAFVTSVTIPNSVVSIGDDAFSGSDLGSVTIGTNVTSLGEDAFSVTPLTSVIIPNSVTNIGDYAFHECAFMTNITIGSGVIYIGSYAFAVCVDLTSVYFKGNAPTFGAGMFINVSHATAYFLPGTSGWGQLGSTYFFDILTAVMLNPPNPAGSLQVTISPAGAMTAGAQWYVDGGIPQLSGATVFGLTVGNHTVSFNTVNGWTMPSSQIVSVSANLTATTNGTYVVQIPLQVTTTSLPNGTNGSAYSQTLTASGGQMPYSWTNISGVLPPGFNLSTNGVISGIPTVAGISNFTVRVTDAASSTATQALSLTINVAVPVFQPAKLTNGQFMLTWSAVSNGVYQLQYKTNLTQANWINIGSTITASNTVLSVTNSTNTDKQRFYRVQQQ
jgi:hypothetical protein